VRDLIASLRTRGTTVFFCSHILADIEVLCDRAAILQGGRLAHVGRLTDLRHAAGDTRAMEIVCAGANLSNLQAEAEKLAGARLTPTPGGARLEVACERDVDAALRAVRASGATLVSVQPVGNPLEELFTSNN
jgi:ABC-2 type transport system ATP-binding protein